MKSILKPAVGAAAGAIVLAVAGSAAALTPTTQTLSVAFNRAAVSAVPLSPWMLGGLGFAIGVATLFILRKRGMHGGLALGIAGFLAMGAMAVADPSRADAAVASLSLTGAGPATLVLPGNQSGFIVTVTNTDAGAVTLTAISLSGNDSAYPDYYTLVGGTCTTNTVLATNQSCTVNIISDR